MNPVQYALVVQRTLLILAALSFVGVISILVGLDPYLSSLYVWALWITLLIFGTAVISLVYFGWVHLIQKKILSVVEVNKIISQSVMSSAVVIFLLVLEQTKQLTLWTGLFTLIVYIFYQFWNNLE